MNHDCENNQKRKTVSLQAKYEIIKNLESDHKQVDISKEMG